MAVQRRWGPWYLILPVLLAGLGALVPLPYLVLRVAEAAGDAGLQELLGRWRNVELLGNTLLLTVVVLSLVTLLALPLAWLTTRARLPGRRLITVLLVMPLALPGYLMAMALLSAGGSYGVVQRFSGVEMPLLKGFWGAVLALTCYNLPYMFLNLRVGLERLDPNLEEAARMLGSRPLGVFWRVVLPQLMPALLAGALLVVLHVLGDFGVVSLMGFETFSYAIYLEYYSGYNRAHAAALASVLLLLTAVVLLLDAAFLYRLRLQHAGRGASRRHRPVALGYWAAPAYGLVGAVVLVAVVLPLSVLLYWLGQNPGATYQSDLWLALRGSVTACLSAALLATALATPVAYLSRRYPSAFSAVLERWAYLGYATPPLAFALAWIFFAARLLPREYQPSQWLGFLILAYSLHFLAEAVGPIRTALYKAMPRYEEAARCLGQRPWGAFCRITFPLIRGGLVASMAFVFLSAMKELPMTFLLAPWGYETLAVNAWSYSNEALFAEAAPYAFAIVCTSTLFVALLLWQGADESPRD